MPTFIDTTNLAPATIATLQGPIISQIQITDSSYNVLDDTAVSTSGGYIKITGSNFTAGTQVVIGTVAASSVTFINSTTLNVQVPAQAAGTYVVYVTTNTGSVAIRVNGLTYSGTPTWVTGSTLPGGQVDSAISIQLSATGDAPITYSLAAGSSLPPGLSLSSAGLISGTVTGITSETVYNFTVNAIDPQLQDSPRAFSITITANDQFFKNVTTLLSANTPASTFVTDASTNNFAVSVFGDTRPSNFGPYTPGYYSNFFDGTGDYLNFPASSAMAMGTGDYTIEFWIYLVGTGDFCVIDNQGSGGNMQISRIGGVLYHGGATPWSYTFTNNVWTHIAFAREGTNLRLFANGVLQQTQTNSNSIGSAANTNVIGIRNDNLYPLNGYLSNIRVVKGTAVYTAAFTPSTTPLTAIANTSLLTCQSNRFIDNSTNNFAITRNGDVRIDSFDPFLPDSNFAGRGSGYFDGSSDYLSLPGSSQFAIATSTTPFTIEAWVYLNAAGGVLFSDSFTGGSNTVAIAVTFSDGSNVTSSTGSTLALGYYTGASWVTAAMANSSISLNTWTHVACVFTGSTTKIFYNGIDVTKSNTPTPATTWGITGVNGDAWYIGRRWDNNAVEFMTGYVSDFRFVNGTAVYTTNFTPPTTPLTAIAGTSLLTLQNNQPTNNNMSLDSSTSNFNITRNGNATQGSFSPYGGGWSNYFDGNGDYLTVPYNASLVQWWDTNYTIEMWIYNRVNAVSGTNSTPLQVAHGLPTANDTYWAFGTNASGNLYWYYFNGSLITNAVSTSTVPLNTWTHVAMVYNNTTSTIKGYINGVEAFSVSKSGTPQSSSGSTLNIGKVQNTDYTGYISNLRIVRGTMVYTSAFTPPTAPLTPIANTQLLTCADNRFIDDSPNNFAITRNGDISVQRFNPFNPVITTPTSYSGFFDGNGDYLQLAANAAFQYGTGNYTIEAWVYLTAVNANSSNIFAQTASGHAYFTLAISPDGTTVRHYVNASGFSTFYSSPSTFTLNTWHHVAAVRSGGTVTVYLNGVGGTSGSNNTDLNNSTYTPRIGSEVQATLETFTGYISNLRIVKGTAVYTSNFTPSTTPLTAITNTSLLTLQSPTFIDNSTNNFTITTNGDTAPRQFNPFGWTSTTGGSAAYTPALYGGSGYFDGTGDYLNAGSNNAFAFGTGAYTVEFWVNLATLATLQIFVRNNNSGGWQVYWDTGTGITLGTVGSPGFLSTGLTGFTTSQWYHVVVSRVSTSSNSTRIFVNGVVRATGTDSTNWTVNGALTMGADGSGTNALTGFLADVRIIKGQALYTSNFQPPIAPLTPVQNTVLLNNMTGAGIYDSSMMANYETAGNASINTSLKKYGNTSMYFDGTGDYLASPDSPTAEPGSANLTWEMWINTTSSTQYATLYSRTTASFASGMWSLMINVASATAGDLALYVADFSNASPLLLTSPLNVRDGAWHHVAVVRNGSAWSLYVDGTSRATGTWAGTIANIAGGPYVGADQFYGRNYAGYIDDLRITNGIARYTATFTPPTSPYIRF